MQKTLLLLTFYLAILINCFAATVTWDGGAGTPNWTDMDNWSTNALPTTSDDVDIDGFTVILSGITAQVQRVYVRGNGQLTIASDATLVIDGFTGNDDGLETSPSGTVINDGAIQISNISGSAADGISNRNVIVNNGSITIAGTGLHGIYTEEGTFTNSSSATISVTDVGQTNSDADCIYVDDLGTFDNNGSISITMTTGDDGIYVNDGGIFNNNASISISSGAGSGADNGMRVDDGAVFNNNNAATLTINETPDDQLFLDLTGSFNNTGMVNLNNANDVGLYVTDQSVFTNASGGNLNISGASNFSIQVDANNSTAAIINNGTISVTGANNDAVRLQEAGTMTNNAALNIVAPAQEGINIQSSGGTFTNTGTIDISSASEKGIEMVTGSFNNSGSITLTNCDDVSLYILNDAIFTNASGGSVSISGANNFSIQVDANSSTAEVINNGTISVTGGTNDAVRLQEAGIMTNNATLTISAPAQEGINIQGSGGTFTNTGTIGISSTSEKGIEMNSGSFNNSGSINLNIAGDIGLLVLEDAVFTNASGGSVNISGASNYSINVDANNSTAEIINDGAISVTGGSNDAVRLQEAGTMTNSGTLTISAPAQEGINIQGSGGTFTNTGTIDISSTSEKGIEMTSGNFNNSGSLTLTNNDDVNLLVLDDAVFTNAPGGSVSISGANNYGIQVDANSSTAAIVNNGAISVSGGSTDGLRLQEAGSVTNNGTLTISDSGSDGINIQGSGGTLTNSGTINISGTTAEGMDMVGGIFNNLSGGLFLAANCLDDGLEVNTATVNNDGDIRIYGSGSEDIETFAGFTFNNTSNATFAPGDGIGEFELKGSLDLGTSTTTFEISGTTHTTEFDRIENFTGSTLTISNATMHLDWGAYVPAGGDCFRVIAGSGLVSGEFSTVTSSNPAIDFEIDYTDPTEVVVCIPVVLPVELVHFTGKKSNDGAQLSWETASETSNEGFDVERSTDSNRWTKIGFVRGSGNSTTTKQYAYLDNAPVEGVNFYRLKQHDFDGKYNYSNIVSLNFKDGVTNVIAFPNPVEDVLNIQFDQGVEDLEIQLYNSSGQILWTTKGNNTQIPFEDYSPGIYFLSVVSSTGQSIQKVIKN